MGAGNFKVVMLGGDRHGEECRYVGSVIRAVRALEVKTYTEDEPTWADIDEYEYKEWVHRQGFYVLKGSLAKPTAADYRFTPEYQNPDMIARPPHG